MMVESSLRGYVGARVSAMSIQKGALVLLVMTIVLSPSVTVRADMYRPRGEDLVLLAVAAVWLLSLPSRRHRPGSLLNDSRGNVLLTRIMAGMSYMAIISICVGAIAFQQRLIFNDLMILPMIARYWLTLQVGQWVGQRGWERTFIWVLLASFGISASIGILQSLNLLGVNEWLTPSYIMEYWQDWNLMALRLGLPGARAVGTHGDPRHYAYMLVVGVCISIALLVTLRRGILRAAAIVALALCLVALVYTASRTPVVSCIVVVLAAVLVTRQGVSGVTGPMSLLLLLSIVLTLISPVFQYETFVDRVVNLDDPSTEYSFQARVRDLTKPFDLAFRDPIIWLTGRGPSKAEVRTDSHNDFGWYFYRFGLPGLLLYVSLIVYSLKQGLHAWSSTADPVGRVICLTAILAMINWLVFAMAENIFKDAQLMALNMVLVGACIGVSRIEQKG